MSFQGEPGVKKRMIQTALFIAPLMPLSSLAQDPEIPISQKLTLGAYYSNGDYGSDEDTSITYIPLTYEISNFPWIFSISIPFLALEGPGDVFLETGSIGRPNARAASNISEHGVGDVILTGSYQFQPVFNNFAYLDFSLIVKLPVADEARSLGTGETDISVQFDLYKIINSTTFYSILGYRKRGRTPLYDLEDSAYFSLGLMQQLSDRSSVGLVYDFREAASSTGFEGHELMPFYSWMPDEQWNLMLYSIVGFTDSSAKQAFGLQLSYSF